MSNSLSNHEVAVLWQRAKERLDVIERERPVSIEEVDKLLNYIGGKAANQSVADWIKSASAQRSKDQTVDVVAAVVVPFDKLRQQFTPIVEFVRLAADDAGREIPLPGRALEDEHGQFRLQVAKEKNNLVIKITALGNASDDYACKRVGLATVGRDPIAVVMLDEDGDGEICLADTTDLRLLLLRPVIGMVEDV